MIYTIFIFCFFVFTFGLNNYLKNRGISLYIKIIHLLITFGIFEYYFLNFRKTVWDIFINGLDAFYTSKEFIYYSKPVDFISSILFFIVSGFMSGLALDLAVKAKSRRLFIYISPLIVFVTSLHLYKFMLEYFNIMGDIYFQIINVLLLSLIFGVIVLFYILKPVRKMFNRNKVESTGA